MIEVQYTMYIFLYIFIHKWRFYFVYENLSIKVMTGGLLFFCFILFYGCGAIQCILMYSYVLNHYHKCFATKRLVGRLALVSHDVGDVPICEFMDSHIKCHYNRVDLLHVLGVNVAIYLPLLFLSVIFFCASHLREMLNISARDNEGLSHTFFNSISN